VAACVSRLVALARRALAWVSGHGPVGFRHRAGGRNDLRRRYVFGALDRAAYDDAIARRGRARRRRRRRG
jgi:hypothetical protein